MGDSAAVILTPVEAQPADQAGADRPLVLQDIGAHPAAPALRAPQDPLARMQAAQALPHQEEVSPHLEEAVAVMAVAAAEHQAVRM